MIVLTYSTTFLVLLGQIYAVVGTPTGHNVSKTVYGGSPARDGQFPYQVFIAIGENGVCGGSIYDEYTIVTAAHCNFDHNKQRIDPYDLTIYAGSVIPQRGQRRFVRYTVVHENYNPNSFGHDIAIIGLSEPLSFNQNVRPIELAPNGLTLPPGSSCTLSGFGSTTNRKGFAGNLRYAQIKIKDDGSCAKRYFGDQWDPKSMACGGGDGTNSCAGDSGGPLVCNFQGRLYNYGAVSMGPNECGTRDFPGTYSKLSYYNQWIRENIHV